MHLDRLAAFVSTVETGSVTLAAKRLHLTQPAITRSLGLLEEDVGLSLFERRGRGLVLTVAGQTFLPLARELLACERSVATRLEQLGGREPATLKLGAVQSVAATLLPDALRKFERTNPSVVVSLVADDTPALLSALAKGMLDHAIIATSGKPPVGVRIRPYRMRYWARRDLFPKLAEVRAIEELDTFPRIVPSAQHADQRIAVATDAFAIKALVLSGFGVGRVVDYIFSKNEGARLVAAAIPSDPNCALYWVTHMKHPTHRRWASEWIKALAG